MGDRLGSPSGAAGFFFFACLKISGRDTKQQKFIDKIEVAQNPTGSASTLTLQQQRICNFIAKLLLVQHHLLSNCYPRGYATLSSSAMPEATSERGRSKLRALSPHRKIDVKRELSVESVSVFTLIRTDTTLDHSQKAEKV